MKPWLSPALIAATAPAPGDRLMAQEAAKKANHTEKSMTGSDPNCWAASVP